MRDKQACGAEDAPLLELSHVETVYFDSLINLGNFGGNMRLLLWRWTMLGGVAVRKPVLEVVRPQRATALIRAEIDQAARAMPLFDIPMH